MIEIISRCSSCLGTGYASCEPLDFDGPSCDECLGHGKRLTRTYRDVPAMLEAFLVDDSRFEYEPVGSRVTCDPPPTNTDEDWIVLPDNFKRFVRRAEDAGFEEGGSDIIQDCPDDVPIFASLRLGTVNLIVCGEAGFYRRFLAASSVAKRLNLLRKDDRIALFQAVLYGNACSGSTTATPRIEPQDTSMKTRLIALAGFLVMVAALFGVLARLIGTVPPVP